MSVGMSINLILVNISLTLTQYFLIALTKVQFGGVNYTPVEHFEIYQHCKQEVSDE